MSKSIKILLTESIHPIAQKRLQDEGYEVDLITHSPGEEELLKILPKYSALGIRSKTELSERIFETQSQLLAVGAFCIGTNQINLQAAKNFGVPVFNAPHSNTRSVAELVLSEMIALCRQLFDRSQKAHRGDWMKSADGSREIRGKVLGIVGYGHIGSQLSILAESLGMKVVFYDVVKKLPLGNATMMNKLSELLKAADFVTLHVPETPQTKNMISKKELALMKKGSFLINASRGTVVVIEDLVESLKNNHLGGCAIDVFPVEPSSNKDKFVSPLQGLPNVILTPHIGGSTEEAQYAIGLEVAESFRRFLKIGSSSGAVNFPNVDLPLGHSVTRILNVHENKPGVLGEINGLISEAGANIQAQYLSTDERIGYLVVDVESDQGDILAGKISGLKRSLKTRSIRHD